MQNNLLILTGPQGSGNHLWSKVFSKHPFVNGWRMKQYWEGHHHEPFSAWWDDASLIEDTGHRYNFTSISCPYVYKTADSQTSGGRKIDKIPPQLAKMLKKYIMLKWQLFQEIRIYLKLSKSE